MSKEFLKLATGVIGTYGCFAAVSLAISLAALALSVFVVVKVLQYTGVL
jgi:heme exporter protein D